MTLAFTKPTKPDISVIIVNYNSAAYIQLCLDSVLAASGNYEVLVIDSGSYDGGVDLVKSYLSDSRLKLLYSDPAGGPVVARNQCAAQSLGRILVFLDCDTVVKKDWLVELQDYLKTHPTVGAGQFKVLQYGHPDIFDSAGERLSPLGFLCERAQGAKDTGQFDFVEPIFSGKAAAMFARKKVFDAVGGFDDGYFMYWEEPDFFWRVWKLGYKVIFFPYSSVWHLYGSKFKRVSSGRLAQITYFGCRNQLQTLLKNAVGLGRWRMILFVSASWSILLFQFFLKGEFRRAAAIVHGFVWVIKNYFKIIQKRHLSIQKIGPSFYDDRQFLSSISINQPIRWFLNKGAAYTANKQF